MVNKLLLSIYQRLRGTASESDQQLSDQASRDALENAERDVQAIWKLSAGYKDGLKVDSQKGWANLKARMAEADVVPISRKRKSSLRMVWRAAAAVLIANGADRNGDGLISYEEAAATAAIVIPPSGITDLSGLEALLISTP